VTDSERAQAEGKVAEAKRLLEQGDARAALKQLDQARKRLVHANDLEAMRELRRVVEEGYRASDERDEPRFEQLLYATAQNIRFLSRRAATARGVEWVDPHPELDAPGRPEIRIERGVGRREVPWILIGTLAGAALIAGFVLLIVAGAHGNERKITNDRSSVVIVGLCDSPCEEVAKSRTLRPGASVTYKTTYDRFAVSRLDGTRIGCVDASKHARTSQTGDC
jgi:hypothetical protein